jgi:hypothetical protein
MRTKTAADAKTLRDYKAEWRDLAAEVFTAIGKLGDLLIRAGKDLSHDDYKALEQDLLTRFTRSDLIAAKAVADGTLAPELFPRATPTSKVLTLSRADQDRLLSGETFDVWTNFGTQANKPWHKMTSDERSRLLGPKGGSIHALDKQQKPGKKGSYSVLVFDAASVDSKSTKLEMASSGARGEITIEDLKNSLGADGVKALISALK